ncbi:protein ELYS-like [Spheniscus humboldti]
MTGMLSKSSNARRIPSRELPLFCIVVTGYCDGTCLLNSGVVHMTCTGFQKETLNFLKKSGPLISEAIRDSYNRCLVAGLLSPRLVDAQPSSLSQNDRDPRLRERAVARNSLLDQYGKILPRVQRTLAVERAKAYHLPSSVLREVLELQNHQAQRILSLMQSCAMHLLGHQLQNLHKNVPAQSPCRASNSFMASNPLNSNMHGSVSQKTSARASELNLLETPLVVKFDLNFLKKSGPLISEAIRDSYNRCLVAGLLSPRLVDAQPSSLSQEEQLEAVLSAAVQAGSLELLTGCIKHWTSEEQPSSAANLRFVLEWTWKKVIYTKDELDQTCVPLFDGSCNFIDPQTSQSLQHCQLLLRNLSTVLNCFLTEAQELTEKGFADLTNKQVVTSLISLYAQVVTWFCRSSLLPEGLDDDTRLSRPFYNYPLIQSYYTGHRQTLERLSRGKWDSDCLMIDGMVSQLGDQVEKLWRRDEGGTGKYPPATLHALLDLYLLENIEESYKHAITIYLLLDIMHSFPNKTETSVDSFPTAFAIPWGLVKLIQGFWLLDHNDYESSLALLFHPATIKTVSWQHRRILHSLMCQGEHRRALRYVQMMKPSTSSSSEVRLFLTVLLSNRCVVEAWGLLQRHTTKLNIEELLKHMYEICQEMGLMEDLLKLPFTGTEQECLEKFLQTSAGVQNHEFLLVHHLQRASYIPALQLNQSMKVNLTNDRDPRLRERAVARNSLLDQYGKILPRVQRTLAVERAKPYHLPSSVLREVARPKPLSTVTKQANAGNVHAKVTFIKNVLSKIGEVRVGHEQKTSLSQYDRLLDSVVHPVPSCSAAQSPCRASTSFMASSPLNSNMHGSVSQKTSARASELNLLETPLVVKRAKVLATSASGFPGFTPRSFLKSSLRTTPLATPSASPGRSVTPPLRAKERRVSFREENADWTAGESIVVGVKHKVKVESPSLLKIVRLRHKPQRKHLNHHHIVNYTNKALFNTAMILSSNSMHVICLIIKMVNKSDSMRTLQETLVTIMLAAISKLIRQSSMKQASAPRTTCTTSGQAASRGDQQNKPPSLQK